MILLVGILIVALAILIYYIFPLNNRLYILFILSLIIIAGISVTVALFSLLFTLANYYFGIVLENAHKKEKIKISLFWGFILIDVGILAFFKYFNPIFSESVSFFSQGSLFQEPLFKNLMVPVGISYYTFQSLGYLIRVSRGTEHAERHFAAFATYLLFFPKFIAGPVERSNHFFPQLHKPLSFDKENLFTGARLVLWGIFKKVAIADVLYQFISPVYNDIHQYSGTVLLFTFLTHCVYIYCDFSGYTDIARGVARCFGIQILQNFNRPFLARNISEFWRRWHISLSSWCNDFIYNPFIIKFRKFGNATVVSGLFLTFFIVGIWHGSNPTYVVLGLLQGAAISYEFFTKKQRIKFASHYSKPLINAVSRILVYVFMSFSMIFFFSNSIQDAWYFLTHLFRINSAEIKSVKSVSSNISLVTSICLFLILFILEMSDEKGRDTSKILLKQPVLVRFSAYLICIAIIWLSYSGFNLFYYARF